MLDLFYDEDEMPIIEPKKQAWEDEWKGMPEYIQERIEPFTEVKVMLNTKEDMEAFSKLINQTLTPKTKSVWYPKQERGVHLDQRYVDES